MYMYVTFYDMYKLKVYIIIFKIITVLLIYFDQITFH